MEEMLIFLTVVSPMCLTMASLELAVIAVSRVIVPHQVEIQPK